jgi:gluconolactonase
MLLALLLAQTVDYAAWPVTRIATGYQFTEGTAWNPTTQTLLFTDIPGNTIHTWTEADGAKAWQTPSGNANGTLIDKKGRVISCQHGERRVVEWKERKGQRTAVTLADRYEGKRLNSPNDACFGPAKSIFFTDPPYGINPKDSELGFAGVFRLGANGTVRLIDRTMNRPNGIGLSPDQRTLYVSDSEEKLIRAWTLGKDGLPRGASRVFARIEAKAPNFPDGLRVHPADGRVFCTAGGGVHVFAPSGERLGLIPIPENPTNCSFGGKDLRTLFVSAQRSIYRVDMR